MAVIAVPEREADRVQHLAEYAPPSEQARNQLILVVTVFVVGAGLRLLGQSWWVTVPGAAVLGLLASMAVLEVWERTTGKRSAQRVTEDRLTPAKAQLFEGLTDFTVRGDAAMLDHSAGQLTVSVRADLAGPPRPQELDPGEPVARAPLPVKGTRYALEGGATAVVPAVWLWVEVRSGPDPRGVEAVERVACGAQLLESLPADLGVALRQSGAAPGLKRALSFNGPWAHRLSVWPEALVITTPLTDQAAARDVGRLVHLLARWQAARAER